MTNLFKRDDSAKRAAERARAEQQIANDRQLAELRASDQRTDATRRSPRGRRLFVSDASQKSSLA